MMKTIFKWLMTLGVALGISTFANAGHTGIRVEEGAVKVMRGSFCVEEEIVLSIFDRLESEGMASSIVLFEEYLEAGMCFNTNIGTAVVVRLVTQFEESIAVEVMLLDGRTLYLVLSNGTYYKGEPI